MSTALWFHLLDGLKNLCLWHSDELLGVGRILADPSSVEFNGEVGGCVDVFAWRHNGPDHSNDLVLRSRSVLEINPVTNIESCHGLLRSHGVLSLPYTYIIAG